jgi:hypothetical protein
MKGTLKMSFIDNVKGFIEKSRAGILLAAVIKEVRSRLDINGDGQLDEAEILQALPTDLVLKYGGPLVSSLILPVAMLIIRIQKYLKDKDAEKAKV